MKATGETLRVHISLLVILFLIVLATNSHSQDTVRISTSEITLQASFQKYAYPATSKTIRYFVVKTVSGAIKTAFDACEVCYAENKGYRQSAEYMICNNCGQRFLISQLGFGNLSGGCWPGHLIASIDKDSVTIKKTDLEKGLRLFPQNTSIVALNRMGQTNGVQITVSNANQRNPGFHFSQDPGAVEIKLYRLDGKVSHHVRQFTTNQKVFHLFPAGQRPARGTYFFSISFIEDSKGNYNGIFTIK